MDDEYSRYKWPMIQKEGSSSSCLNWGHDGDSSWEEQAFAEDGGVWPPRSYTCSFCRREFRSAQALGGHMNVHRRDRAKLKQQLQQQNNNIHDSTTSSNNNKNSQILQTTKLQNPNIHHEMMICSSNISSSASFDLDLFISPSRPSSSASILIPPAPAPAPAAFTCSFSRTTTHEQRHQSNILFSCSNYFEPPAACTKRSSIHILQDSGNLKAVERCTTTKVVESNYNYYSTTDDDDDDDSSKKKKIKNQEEEEELQVNEVHNLSTTGNKLISSSSSLVRKRPASCSSFHDDDDGLIIFKKRQRFIMDADDHEYYLFPKNSNLQVINNKLQGDEEEVEPAVPAAERSPNSTLESLDLELRLGT